MKKEMPDGNDGNHMSKLKGWLSRIGGTAKGWFGQTKHALRAGAGSLKGRSRRAES